MQERVATKEFNFRGDVTFVLENLGEFGISHYKPWNGTDEGVIWFTNAAIEKRRTQ